MKISYSITENFQLPSLPGQSQPLITFLRLEDLPAAGDPVLQRFSSNFYCIALIKNSNSRMTFTAPKQGLIRQSFPIYQRLSDTGYVLFFHQDYLCNSPLASKIKNSSFFSCLVNDDLKLSKREEKCIEKVFISIEGEFLNIDKHSQNVIITQIELLLSYSNRFLDRKYNSGQKAPHVLVLKMDQLMNEYFDTKLPLKSGILTVVHIASCFNFSAHYFSDLIRLITGEGAQYHIQEKIVERAKQYLSITDLTVSEIAYELGFKHPQSFNKLFKRKTNTSPLGFRRSLNNYLPYGKRII